MELTKQYASREIALELQKLGVKKEHHYVWVGDALWDGTMQSDYETRYMKFPRSTWVPTYSVAELFEFVGKNVVETYPNAGTWQVGHDSRGFEFQADTLADAMGKMLIYLLSNNLIK